METHADVLRLEVNYSASHEVLKSIEKNTGTVAQFFEQLDTVTKLAAGKNQVPVSLVISMLVLMAVGVFIVLLKESGMGLKIPYLGIEITHEENAKDK